MDQFSQTLLWIHQEEWQQNLMIRYGNTMSLIDATYKTTKYDLPLFFVTVRTNIGYKVVAHFIIQSETTEQILEALRLIGYERTQTTQRYVQINPTFTLLLHIHVQLEVEKVKTLKKTKKGSIARKKTRIQ